MSGKQRLLIAAVMIAAFGMGGATWAAIADNGVVNSCYSKATGTWRPIDLIGGQKCKSGEAQLDFYTKQAIDQKLGAPRVLAYAHVSRQGVIDTARTSSNVTITNNNSPNAVFCLSTDFDIKGGSVVVDGTNSQLAPALDFNGSPTAAPTVFGAGNYCGDAQAVVYMNGAGGGVYVTLIG